MTETNLDLDIEIYSEFICYICRQEYTYNGFLPELGVNERMICDDCVDFVNLQQILWEIANDE